MCFLMCGVISIEPEPGLINLFKSTKLLLAERTKLGREVLLTTVSTGCNHAVRNLDTHPVSVSSLAFLGN